jgi:TRAP-type C4-dicarboxylate transport system permease large subunit
MAALGVDFYTFYIIMVVAVGIGQLTPPVALVLYVVSGITDEQVPHILREALPYIMMLVILAIIVIVFPAIATFLPSTM